MASCAVPFGYPPVRIDGHLYCDGGLLSVMPVWAAAALWRRPGHRCQRPAQYAVEPSCAAAVRMVRLLAPREPPVTGIEVLRLGPERVLGKLHDAIAWDEGNVRRWIDRGQAGRRSTSSAARNLHRLQPARAVSFKIGYLCRCIGSTG